MAHDNGHCMAQRPVCSGSLRVLLTDLFKELNDYAYHKQILKENQRGKNGN